MHKCLAALACLSGVVLLAPAPGWGAEEAPKPPVPFAPPGKLAVLFRLRAEGEQIYVCKKGKGGKLGWEPKAPRADLYDDSGAKVGTHGMGPNWTGSDGSKVFAKVKAKRAAPDARDVPWLLLQADRHEGKGLFSKVRYVQRVDTWAGHPPAKGCDRADKEVRVKYQATYLFYGDRR